MRDSERERRWRVTERAMSELEHVEPVSIHSLLTTETLSDTGRSSLTREGEVRFAAPEEHSGLWARGQG